MENLYKLVDYMRKLPNPKQFPISDNIIAIRGQPHIFCDGFLLDLYVSNNGAKRLKEKAARRMEYSSILNVINDVEGAALLLTAPIFIYEVIYPTYIVYTKDNYPLAIQVKYYRYLRNRHKNCQFYIKDNAILPIVVKVDDKIVGICMPIFLEKETINKLKEERK